MYIYCDLISLMIIPPPLLDFSSDERGKEMKTDKKILQALKIQGFFFFFLFVNS